MPLQFGWMIPMGMRNKEQRPDYMPTIRRGSEIIVGHFDSIWFVDHLQYGNSDVLEGWTALTYLAALYPQFQFGHAVLCQSFRNPALLAKMAATLQFMSNGRFILGLGAGWKKDEYSAYGYDFPSPGTRVEELEETVQIIRALWTQEQATFIGKHYRVEDARFEPKPGPMPTLMIGAFRPRMFRLTARYADWWSVSWTAPERYAQLVEECEKACLQVGRDPGTLRRTWYGGLLCRKTQAELDVYKDKITWGATGLIGTPEQVIEQLAAFRALGVDYFMLNDGGFPDLTSLELFVSEVMPRL